MNNNEEIKAILKSIEDSKHKLEQYNVTLDANISALKERVEEYREEISSLNSLINTENEAEDTISKMQLATENMVAARQQLEELENQLTQNTNQIEEEDGLSKRITNVFEKRQEIYDNTQKVLDDYEKVKDTKYGAAALKAKVEIANQKRNIVDENMQKALEKAGELGHVEIPEKELDEKEDLRLAQKILDKRINNGTADEKDINRYENVKASLEKIGGNNQAQDISIETKVEKSEMANNAPTKNENEEIDSFLEEFDKLPIKEANEVDENSIVEVPENEIEVSVETDDKVQTTNDDTAIFDPVAFMKKENMDEYTDDELRTVREGLGKAADEPLTDDDINLFKVTSNFTPEVPRKVVMIDKASEVIKKAIDGVKAHKALSAAVAIGVAIVFLNPALAAGAVALGAGAEAYKYYNKGKSL